MSPRSLSAGWRIFSDNVITENAPQKLQDYNNLCLHYNLVADSVYNYRKECDDLFAVNYLRYIVAALISFDMGRMMGNGLERKYDIHCGGFATRLFSKLQVIREDCTDLINLSLVDTDLDTVRERIQAVYGRLSEGGHNSLSEEQQEFHVGATKIMHFLNPSLFLIIDSNAARAFRCVHNIPYRANPPQGFTAARYVQCLYLAKQEILDYGIDNFQSLEPASPLLRIFDKLAFVTGKNNH